MHYSYWKIIYRLWYICITNTEDLNTDLPIIMIEYYFRLQFRRLTREITEIGLHPVVGIFLIIVIFHSASILLFHKLESAHYIYLVFAISTLTIAGNKERNEFLKNCFTTKDYRKIRVIENLILVTP